MKKLLAGLLAICMLMCTACGSQDIGNTDTSTLHCPQCGVGMAETDKFCGSCGYAVGAIITTKSTTMTQNVATSTTQSAGTSTATKNTTTKNATPSTTKQTTTKQLASTQAGHVHSWSAATCEKPRTCECGATSGEARGHSYLAATCTEAEKCFRCEQTKGKPLGHILKGQATCTGCDQCSRCNRYVAGTALGHDYNKGKCTRCGEREEGYYETYNIGETWLVDGDKGQWEFTVNSVTVHYNCNSIWDRDEGYNGEQIVIINYTYKNISYTFGSGLGVFLIDFEVYDEQGENADIYACTHKKEYANIIPGMKHTASQAYALPNDSTEIVLVVNRNFMDGVTAKFILPVG